MEKKTVCVVTGTRAEYGLLRGVVKKLAQSRTLAVRLVVTGAHLAQEFGMTVREIEADGVPIEKEKREAIEAGRRALNSLSTAKENLNSAKNW